jgi:tetratricopeptide (TPR) repeat protein
LDRLLAERAIALDDQDSWAYALRGRVASFQRRHANALSAFERAIELNPNKAEVLAERGASLIWAGQTEDGLRSYETVEKYDPNMNAIHLATLGIGYYLARRYDDAIRVLDRSAQLSPGNSFSVIGLAAAHAQLGHKERAAELAAEVRRQHPFFEPAEFGRLLANESQHAHLTEGLARAGIR